MNNIYGRVIKKKNKKIVVIVKKCVFLPIYKKRIFFYSKIIAYDMYNESNCGDYVMLRKTRPLSKTIFWILSKVLEKVRLI
ncbi:30S ribosomal protein S17 [Candidatus Carsonella ruddii]|uniref:30S ribosomal protein S17 n=1 Tax=Carsonella ruddii TaxID=114186 RepID=A0AAJ6FK92_CARRU|nr:30S ribosomal protein S17 [Candidatus Carsonella ruddii]WGS66637.1 30S ribosomal protein S17 [Candidatus Carsonella ruddii]WGS66834.1 30S ribosomal protein S17 [Candidatus Carsonella ruddii]WGS67026.1 30S ribosomal protein S17 [Candidatus Carsonella ruddii]WGS67217.1 30S ribosomal protein S17 [Candidatus Carsonella ruddii]WMC18235.1 MAG: 30S ribosomal protein S17 [Candidatus Carsonella ruddii]